MASLKGWPLKITKEENWTLWQLRPERSDWLVIGAHGCSEHEADLNVKDLFGTRIYFITQRLAAAPGKPNSWYVNRAFEGVKWSMTEKVWHEIEPGEWRYVPSTTGGRIEVFNTENGEAPFDYHLTRYIEDKHVKTITDMYEGGALRGFDVITVSKGGAKFSEILAWLSNDHNRHYPHIVAGFCNSTSYSKFMTPFGDYLLSAPPKKPMPQLPGAQLPPPPPPRLNRPLPTPPGQLPPPPPPPMLGSKPLPTLPGGRPVPPPLVLQGKPLPTAPGQLPPPPPPPVLGNKPLPTPPTTPQNRVPLKQYPHGGPPKKTLPQLPPG